MLSVINSATLQLLGFTLNETIEYVCGILVQWLIT